MDDDVTLKQVLALVKEDGIPLYVVPRSNIVRDLVYSDSAIQRRGVLVECKELIFEDCRGALNRISSKYALEMKSFILSGLDAVEAGYCGGGTGAIHKYSGYCASEFLGTGCRVAAYNF